MDLKEWMGILEPHIRDKKLSEIVIPGSHDSGSYCITKHSKRTDNLPDVPGCLECLVNFFGPPWSKTQEHPIHDHLCLGVRYIDMRVYLDSDMEEFFLVHGFEGGRLYREMIEIMEFVDKHPTEIVILDMNHVYKCNDTSVDQILDNFQRTFGKKLCPPSAPGQCVPTYGEMMTRGWQVIVAISDSPAQCNSAYTLKHIREDYPWVWSSKTNIRSPWANTKSVRKLKKFLKRSMSWPRETNALHVTQTILTPTTLDTLRGALAIGPKNLQQLAGRLRKHLPDWFSEFTAYGLNIAIVDYLDTELITHMVNLNTRDSVEEVKGLVRVESLNLDVESVSDETERGISMKPLM